MDRKQAEKFLGCKMGISSGKEGRYEREEPVARKVELGARRAEPGTTRDSNLTAAPVGACPWPQSTEL